MSESPPLLTSTIILTALLLALIVLTQTLSAHMEAYLAAPTEINVFLETCTDFTSENESYDLDTAQFSLLRDRVRLHTLYRTIQSNNDTLREELVSLLHTPIPFSSPDAKTEFSTPLPTPRLKASARLLWRLHRKRLEERVRRGDMLRTRYLVQFLALIASKNNKSTNTSTVQRDPEKWALPLAREIPQAPPPPPLPMSPPSTPGSSSRPPLLHALTEGVASTSRSQSLSEKRGQPTTRRLATSAMGHNSAGVGGKVRPSWGNVIEELQRSPLMHRRRESIEVAMLRQMQEEQGQG